MFEGDRTCQFGHSNRLYCHNTGFILSPPLCSRVLLCLGGGKMVLNVMLVDRFFLLVQFLHDPLKKRPQHKQFHFDAYE